MRCLVQKLNILGLALALSLSFLPTSGSEANPIWGPCNIVRKIFVSKDQYWEKVLNKEVTKSEFDAEVLYRRYLQGEPHTKLLVDDFGFRFVKNTGGKVHLKIPKDHSIFFKRSNEIIDQQLKSGELKVGEELRPAVIFVKKGKAGLEYQFVRPGIDPYPAPLSGWHVPNYDESEISQTIWGKAMQEGKMPVSLSFLDHDLAHLTEILTHPRIAAETRLGYLRANNFLGENADNPLVGRTFLASEYSSVPDFKKQNLVNLISPHLKQVQGPLTLGKNLQLLDAYDSKAILGLAENIIHHQEGVLLRFGGAARDSINDSWRITNNNFPALTRELNKPWSAKYLPRFSPHSLFIENLTGKGSPNLAIFAASESLHGIVSEIRVLKTLSSAVKDGKLDRRLLSEIAPDHDQFVEDFFFRHFYKVDTTYLKEKVEALLRDRINRFQVALHNAQVYRITPELVVHEAYQVAPNPDSKVAKYFQSFTEPHHITHQLFSPTK